MGTIFAMFDADDSGAISLTEWETVTGALQKRLKRVSPVHRTGAKLHTGCASPARVLHFATLRQQYWPGQLHTCGAVVDACPCMVHPLCRFELCEALAGCVMTTACSLPSGRRHRG